MKIVITIIYQLIVPFRQITICFHGDKAKWMSMTRIWMVELGPLIRFALDLFEQGELILDLENETTVKEINKSNRGKKTRNRIQKRCYRYLYQNDNICYESKEYWPKNEKRNLILMEWGLNNRIYPLKLSKNFIIPMCYKS